jgi:hypothetical protein
MKLEDKNNIPKLKQELKELMNSTVKVGILAGSDSQLIIYAGANEFGAKIPISESFRKYLHAIGFHIKKSTTHFKIPERSYIRKAFDEQFKVDQILNRFKIFLSEKVFKTGAPLRNALEFLGHAMVDHVRERIVSDIEPSNHPITLHHKGAGKSTLYDTGRLQQSINFEIE